MYKGQHIQVIQRINNDFCLVQLLNSNHSNGTDSTGNQASNQAQKQLIEVQIPIGLIKSRIRSSYDGKIILHFEIVSEGQGIRLILILI